MSISKIEHKGKAVFEICYTGCRKKEEMLEILKEAMDIFLSTPEKHLLVLFDYRGAYLSTDYIKASEKYQTQLEKVKTGKGAVLGVEGIKKFILKTYNALSNETKIVPFNTREEALDYLVS